MKKALYIIVLINLLGMMNLFAGMYDPDIFELTVVSSQINKDKVAWGSPDIEVSYLLKNESNSGGYNIHLGTAPTLQIQANGTAIDSSNYDYTASFSSSDMVLTAGETITLTYNLNLKPLSALDYSPPNPESWQIFGTFPYEKHVFGNYESSHSLTAPDPVNLQIVEEQILSGTYENLHLLSGETYSVPNMVTVTKTLTIHGGTVVKLGVAGNHSMSVGRITLSGSESRVLKTANIFL